MDYLGVIMMLAGLGVALLVAFAIGWKNPSSAYGQIIIGLTPPVIAKALLGEDRVVLAQLQSTRPGSRETPKVVMPESGEDVLRQKQALFINIDGRQQMVKGRVTLLELQFFGNDKNDKRHIDPRSGERLREFPAWWLAGNQFLVETPSRESGRVKFFLYEDRTEDMPRGFTEYLRGDDSNPGPAMEFVRSDQKGTVYLEALERRWLLEDIQWMDVQQDNGEFFVHSRSGIARVVMVLARDEDSDDYLLFADLRSGDGSDTLWVGQSIDPDVVVQV
jgi:hypothetical protein